MAQYPVCLLFLAGCLVTEIHTDPGGNHTAPSPSLDVPWVACATLECGKPCPTLPPVCSSGVIQKCGCCDVCWRHLSEGQLCRKFLHGNALCGPGLICSGGGLCELLPQVSSSEEGSS